MAIYVELVHDEAVLMGMQEDWETLQDNSEAVSVFATWEWMTHWWTHHKKDSLTLWLMLARENDHLIGIAPLMLSQHREAQGVRWKQLSFLSSTAPVDHWDFIVERGRETQVVTAFINKIQSVHGVWDVVSLGNILPSSPSLSVLRNSGVDWVESNGHECPYIALPDDFDTYFAQLSRKKRKMQRQYVRAIEKQYGDDWEFEVVCNVDRVEAVLHELIDYHQSKWKALGQPGAFDKPEVIRFYVELVKRLAARGWLWLPRLRLGDDVGGVYFCFVYRGRLSFFSSGLNHDLEYLSPGHVLTEYLVHHAIDAGIQEYDFMWGDEDYKQSWGTEIRIDRVLTWYATPKARMAKGFVDVVRAGRARLRDRLQHDMPEIDPE